MAKTMKKDVNKLEERKYAVCIIYKDGKVTHKYYGSHKKAYAYAERKFEESAKLIESVNIEFTATIMEQWLPVLTGTKQAKTGTKKTGKRGD